MWIDLVYLYEIININYKYFYFFGSVICREHQAICSKPLVLVSSEVNVEIEGPTIPQQLLWWIFPLYFFLTVRSVFIVDPTISAINQKYFHLTRLLNVTPQYRIVIWNGKLLKGATFPCKKYISSSVLARSGKSGHCPEKAWIFQDKLQNCQDMWC